MLKWHPECRLLVAGWENGELNSWMTGSQVFTNISGPHKGPLIFLEFSEQGGRMVTADSVNAPHTKIAKICNMQIMIQIHLADNYIGNPLVSN